MPTKRFITKFLLSYVRYILERIIKLKDFFNKKKTQHFSFFLLSLQSQSEQGAYSFNYEDERRALREELEKFRRENELLRKSFSLNSNKTSDDERQKFTTTTTASVDSGLGIVTPGMSSTFISSSALQFELNESQERERKLEEKIISLQKVRKRKVKKNSFYDLTICFHSNLIPQYLESIK